MAGRWSSIKRKAWRSLPLAGAWLCLTSCSLLFEPTASQDESTIVFQSSSFGTVDGRQLQFTHSVEPGDNRLLLVSSHVNSSSFTTLSVTHNGIELTQIGTEIEIDPTVGEDCNSSLWYLVNPDVGEFPVVAMLDADEPTTRRMATWSLSFSEVDPIDPFVGAIVTNVEATGVGSASLSVMSSKAGLVVDGICFGQRDSASLRAPQGQTVLIQAESVDSRLQVAGSSNPGSEQTTMSWTHDIGPHTHHAVALNPAP